MPLLIVFIMTFCEKRVTLNDPFLIQTFSRIKDVSKHYLNQDI